MITLLAFVIFLALGMPVAFVLIATTFAFIASTGGWRMLDALPQILFSSIEIFDLLAIPLFILLGELMNAGGITRRFITASRAWLGWVPHSLAYVALCANLLVASIMGSATAQIAIMSRVMVPALEKDGYHRSFAAALIAGAGMLGPIIPPSMVFIIYGVIGQVSIGAMFLGGILPGLVLFVLMCAIIAVLAPKAHAPSETPEPLPSLGAATVGALAGLTIPAVIFGGISFGIVTPTESAAIALLLAGLIGLAYRELHLAEVSEILGRTARNTATVLFLIAAAKLFGWVLTFNQVPQTAAAFLQSLTTDPTLFMLLVFVLLLVVGMVLDGIAALIILVPILLPIAQGHYGIDPVQFGVMVCLTLVLGLLTPPVGAGLYISAAIANVRIGALSRRISPYIVAVCLVIIAIILFPALTLRAG